MMSGGMFTSVPVDHAIEIKYKPVSGFSHSVCFNVASDIISKNRNIIQWKTHFCQFSNMGSSGLRKMLTLKIPTLDGV